MLGCLDGTRSCTRQPAPFSCATVRPLSRKHHSYCCITLKLKAGKEYQEERVSRKMLLYGNELEKVSPSGMWSVFSKPVSFRTLTEDDPEQIEAADVGKSRAMGVREVWAAADEIRDKQACRIAPENELVPIRSRPNPMKTPCSATLKTKRLRGKRPREGFRRISDEKAFRWPKQLHGKPSGVVDLRGCPINFRGKVRQLIFSTTADFGFLGGQVITVRSLRDSSGSYGHQKQKPCMQEDNGFQVSLRQ